jgi:glycosyltransferase involved in cell wall biosynthesis
MATPNSRGLVPNSAATDTEINTLVNKDRQLRKPFVVYWNNIPAPYMVDRFNAVADRGVLDFEAWFNERTEIDRTWEIDEVTWRFRSRYLPTTHVFGRKCHLPLPILDRRPDVLVSLYAEPVFLSGWFIAKLRGSRTAFWCQVTHDRWVKRTWLKNAVKRFIFPRIDASLGSGEQSRQFAKQFGVPDAKALTLQHSIDVHHYVRSSAQATERREALRREHGLQGVTFIYVGRLWWGKGLSYLLDAFDSVQNSISEPISLLLVGDGPEENALMQRVTERSIRNVVFAGFKQKAEVPAYFAMADIFVFPTLGDPYGLVVDEAMACSLPVISTTAAGEITDRVTEGVNGYLVAPENSRALADRMRALAQDPALCREMGAASFKRVQGCTPDKWAKDLEEVVSELLERNRSS